MNLSVADSRWKRYSAAYGGQFTRYKLIAVTVLSLIYSINAYSAQIYLKNGDRISGKIIEQNNDSISIDTEAMGTISVKKELIDRLVDDMIVELPEADRLWQRELSLGYNKTSGNTQNSQLSFRLFANRKSDRDEFTIKADNFYSSSNKKMDSQKWYGMIRYAFSFWDRRWYNFYKLEGDHDRFANIDYRLIPASGIGYWFSDSDDWKAMAEVAIGLEHTKFKDNTKGNNELILVPRVFFKKKLIGSSRISQDLTLYPSLEDTEDYRLHSETKFTNPINDRLSLDLSVVDDYNSNPTKNAQKNDIRFISAFTYSF